MFSERSSKNYRAMRDCIIGNPCALVLLGSYLGCKCSTSSNGSWLTENMESWLS